MAIFEYIFLAIAVLGFVLGLYQHAFGKSDELSMMSLTTSTRRKTSRAKAAPVRRPWVESTLLTQ